MPNPKATSLSDALQAVTSDVGESPSMSLEDALRQLASESAQSKPKPSDSGALVMAGAQAIAPTVTNAVSDFATNPAVPQMAAKAGRVMGGIAPIVAGAQTGGVPGALAGVAASAKGAWAGGRTGYFTGKLMQGVSEPVAKVLEALSPYIQTLSTLSGAQGINDLAQMAEPNREDIGVLGIGGRGSAADRAAVMQEQIKNLMAQGLTLGEASRQVYNAWVKK